ncbi:MAG: 6-phosphofructokinase [Clostridia bacterium]|nr:6-phosphofructokinase [Clostridia bacterium]
MEKQLFGNAIVGQSGGPTAAINATLAGVIEGVFAAQAEKRIGKLYGMQNGMEGLLAERLIDLDEAFADRDRLQLLKNTPASALGSCRKKLPLPEKDPATYAEILRIFRKFDIRYFFYIGGNDSMDAVAKLSAYFQQNDYEIRIIGVPKTIDNDLVMTDHTPGFGSAAKYIATTVQEILRDCAVYTVRAVTIVEIMGRDAGWLTTAAALPGALTGIGVDYLYLPERDFDQKAFLADIAAAFERHPNVVIAVSEGLRDADGHYVGEGTQSGVADAFGHRYLAGTGKALELAVKEAFGCKVRSIELNLPQRCASHLASATDIAESVAVGSHAVSLALAGESGCMATILRKEGESYAATYGSSPVSQIANAVKHVPDEFINEAGNGVTEACVQYLRPLIVGEVAPAYENGLPVHCILM